MDGGGGNGVGSATSPPVGPALPPINVARPSETVVIPVTNDGEEMAGPRKARPLAQSRFKPANGSANATANGTANNNNNNPEPKLLARVREEMGDSPKSSPGTPRSPGTYDLFKTRSRKFSGPLEKLEKNSGPLGRQVSRMRSRRLGGDGGGGVDVEAAVCKEQLEQRAEDENGGGMKTALSANRYFQALSGPELEDVKDKENLLLPHDEKWPFLLRFPIGTFGVALGLGSQTMLWKTLAQVPEMDFYFEAVRREYHHPVRVNFFFAPWIAALFLAIGVPPRIATSFHPAVWCCFMLPIFLLELKIYGQWLSGGQRRLSKVANPSTHLSVVGNFVGSTLAAIVGWTEPALFFWAVGLAHYLVLFVTLYQRLPTNETLPSDLHPVFFLFVAAPSAASVAWMRIVGEFDYVSRLVFFISLFLYTSLIVRINFFRGFKFSITWWAYTFPMTAASIAAIQYCHVATSWITRALAVALSFISSATVCTLFVTTLLHVFWWRCLFPNDLAIAITAYKPKTLHFKTSDTTDDGCGLYSLQHSEPLYKSMLDAYHSFLSARDAHLNGTHHHHDLDRSTTV